MFRLAAFYDNFLPSRTENAVADEPEEIIQTNEVQDTIPSGYLVVKTASGKNVFLKVISQVHVLFVVRFLT